MARARLSILFLTQFPPSPPRFGAQARIHGLMTALAERHEVSAVSVAEAAEVEPSLRAMRRYCREAALVVDPRGASRIGRRLLQLRSLASLHSFERHAFRFAALQRRVDAILAARRFDVVDVEGPNLVHLRLRGAPRGEPPPRVVLDEHNVEYDVLRQVAWSGTGIARRVYAQLNWRKLRRDEHEAWDRADAIAVTSRLDEDRVREARPAARVAVVPNAVDLDRFRRRSGDPRPDGRTVLFFGALDYVPNTDAILFFLDEVWPRVRRAHPGARLRVLGRRPPEALLRRRAADVDVPGFVDDLRPALAQAAAVVAPLRMGGGTRLKILEAMAMERPVVSTDLGAEGLGARHGEELLLADDPERFAAEVARLLRDPTLGGRLGAAARRLVEARYSWRASARALEDLYRAVLRGPRARRATPTVRTA
jgi:glycosyltransferase involved in cell wall biosynthesis